ncbi:MAG: ABC transporter transmembrane domain-containing protein, partial [Xanthobacteraceae bacterium]
MEPATSEARGTDPLADALVYLAARHGRALSREALLGGLPVADGRLNIKLFPRAALRAGLEAEAVKRDLSDIPALVLPAVLVMKDGSTRILVEIDRATKKAKVINPSSRTGADPKPGPEPEYSGYAFLVRPVAEADARAVAAGDLPRTHWFWSVVAKFGQNYSHVAIAALVVNILALAAPLFIMNVYDRVIPNAAIPSLIALAFGLGIAILFDFILRVVRSRIIDMTGKQVDVVLAANIFEHVMSLKMAQRPQSVGILANQLRDFDSVRDFFTSGTVVAITDLGFALIFLTVLYLIVGPLALVPAVMLPLMLIFGLALQRPLDRAMKRLQAESAARHGVLVEALSGMETVRATGAEARMQGAWERSIAATARSGEDVHFWASLALTAASSAQQITTMAIVIWGVFLVMDGD